jgi:hypothetical protein
MMSPQLLLLVERRAELQGLFDDIQYRHDATEPDSVQQMEQVAKRAIQIIQEWPDNYWPLESEENLWPEQQEVIDFLELGLAKAAAYRKRLAPFDFEAWMEVRRDFFAGLYWFRNPADDNQHDED